MNQVNDTKQPMSTWKKIVLLNVGLFGGIFLSIFLAPPETPVWLWAAISVILVAVMNYLAWRRLKGANVERKSSLETNAVIAFGVLVLLLDLIFRYIKR